MENEIIRAFDGFAFFRFYWSFHFVCMLIIAIKCFIDIVAKIMKKK